MFRSFKTIISDFLIYFLVELLLFNTYSKHMLPHDNNAVFVNILNILRIE